MPSARSTGTTQEPLDGVAVLGDLVQVGLGEEAGVGHQALVHRAELVDAELGVGDEAAVLAPGLLAEQQVAQHPLQRRVPEAGLVDQRGRLRQEQVGAQAVEDQARPARRPPPPAAACPWSTSANSRASESYRCVPFDGARAGQLDQRQVAEPVEAVALVVLLRADGQHLQLGRRLGVEQEQDPVQVAQRLPGQRLRLVLRQRVEPLRLAALDHLVGDDLDRQPDALAQVLGHADGVLDGVLEDAVPPDVALGVRGERLGAHAGQGAVDLAAALGRRSARRRAAGRRRGSGPRPSAPARRRAASGPPAPGRTRARRRRRTAPTAAGPPT